MHNALYATTFKHSIDSFCETLEQQDITYKKLLPQPGKIMASGLTLEIILDGGWAVLAVAIISWVKFKKSRKVGIKNKQGETIWIEGYSKKDVISMLEHAREITVIETDSGTNKS